MSESLATHVEYAKSGRSECVKCHRPIAQGSIRIGRQFHAHHEGQRYYHLKCWTPKDNAKKPVDYIFGFEHLQAKDQIAVNKHCGFADEGAVAADHHVAGVAQTAAQTAAAAPTPAFTSAPTIAAINPAPSQVTSAPSFGSGGGSFSFGTSSPTKTTVSPFGAPQVSQLSSPAKSTFGAAAPAPKVTSFGSSAASSAPLSVHPASRSRLLEVRTLNEALMILSAGNGPQVAKLQGGGLSTDAHLVLSGAFELFLYDRDADEFLHTVSRVLLATR